MVHTEPKRYVPFYRRHCESIPYNYRPRTKYEGRSCFHFICLSTGGKGRKGGTSARTRIGHAHPSPNRTKTGYPYPALPHPQPGPGQGTPCFAPQARTRTGYPPQPRPGPEQGTPFPLAPPPPHTHRGRKCHGQNTAQTVRLLRFHARGLPCIGFVLVLVLMVSMTFKTRFTSYVMPLTCRVSISYGTFTLRVPDTETDLDTDKFPFTQSVSINAESMLQRCWRYKCH